MSRVRRIVWVLWTWFRWGWRCASLGGRTALGSPKLATGIGVTTLGRHVTIMDGWVLADLRPGEGQHPKIRIEDWCTFMFDCQINAAVSVQIGEGCLFASRVFVSDSDHVLEPGVTLTSRCATYESSPVVIEHNCWLGQNAVVLKGVTVGHHSIVAANAVVNRDVPPHSIVGGVPARVIGTVPPGGPSAEVAAAASRTQPRADAAGTQVR